MPLISDDVAAVAKREYAHRTRLAAFIALVLAWALFILPAFKSPITSITGDSRLLGPLDVCRQDRDDCPTDHSKTKPGLCGCGVPDTDTDGDGTPDCNDGCPRDVSKTSPGACGCGITDIYSDTDRDGTPDCKDGCPHDARKTSPGACGCGITDIYTDTDGDGIPDCNDGCPRDASKTNYGVCGCGAPDTDTDGDKTPDCLDRCPADASKTSPGVCGCGSPDTDTDGDGTLDCRDDCIDNDPSILSICESNRGYDCEGCAGKYVKIWKECGLMCLSDIDYCLEYSYEDWSVYDDSIHDYRIQRHYEKMIQTGADSSNTVIEFYPDDDITDGGYYWFVNGVPCFQIENDTTGCLVCDDGKEYCKEWGVPPLPSNPFFCNEGEARSLLETCFASDTVTTSEFEMKPIGSKLSQYARAFFNHGA